MGSRGAEEGILGAAPGGALGPAGMQGGLREDHCIEILWSFEVVSLSTLCSAGPRPRVGQVLYSWKMLRGCRNLSSQEDEGSCSLHGACLSLSFSPPTPASLSLSTPQSWHLISASPWPTTSTPSFPAHIFFHAGCLFSERQNPSQASDIYSLELEKFPFLFPRVRLVDEISSGISPALLEAELAYVSPALIVSTSNY